MAQHDEVRALVHIFGEEQRKRGTVVDKLLAFTDDGRVIHVPTGHNVPPPRRPDGGFLEVKDDRKYALHMLDADPEGWVASRSYGFGDHLTPALRQRLISSSQSYPGD